MLMLSIGRLPNELINGYYFNMIKDIEIAIK